LGRFGFSIRLNIEYQAQIRLLDHSIRALQRCKRALLQEKTITFSANPVNRFTGFNLINENLD
jgi:hypothetical protein